MACVRGKLEQVGEHKVQGESVGQHAGDNEQLTRMPGDGRRVLVEHEGEHRDEGHCDAGEDDCTEGVADGLVMSQVQVRWGFRLVGGGEPMLGMDTDAGEAATASYSRVLFCRT